MDVGYLRSRIARRLFVLFVACALVPICIATILMATEFNSLSQQRADERLGDLARAQGMAFIDRLLAADDLVRALMSASEAALPTHWNSRPDESVLADLREVSTSEGQPAGAASGLGLPLPLQLQLQALDHGLSVVLFQRGSGPSADAYLVCSRAPGRLVYARLNKNSLWPDSSDFPDGAQVVVLDSQLNLLHATGPTSVAMTSALRAAMTSGKTMNRATGSMRWRDGAGSWRGQYWETFLGGRFATPSLYVLAYSPSVPFYREMPGARVGFPAIIGLATLAIVWLSISQIRRQIRPLERLIAGTRRLAQRDFSTIVVDDSADEIGELARSFNTMATSLQRQFGALASMAEIDRLLLGSPDLESVLDHLLPRLGGVLGAKTVSVMLLDKDAPGRCRLYDYVAEQQEVRPVRRAELDLAAMANAAHLSSTSVAAESPEFANFGYLAEMVTCGSKSFQVEAVRLADHIAGILCVGFADQPHDELIQQARDFADRLGVVLANLNDRAQLYRQAHFDPLTGLANRALFHERLEEATRKSIESRGCGALLYIDLDHFKRVNDSAGHETGDELLQIVSKRLKACVKDGDTVARLGGDEFAIVLRELSDPEDARAVCARILELLARTIQIGDRDQFVSASIGIAVFPANGTTAKELLTHSDVAMYRAKDSGRSQAVSFEPEMYLQIVRRSTLDSDLHRALHARHFQLHYQPIVRCRDQTVVSAEALIRWPTASGFVARAPSEFIPAAEDNGLIVEIGAFVLDSALRDLATWRRRELPLEYVSVNVSPRQLRDSGFLMQVEALLRKHAIDPSSLQIEITESVLGEGAQTHDALRQLASMGVRLAIDDFGTGYSSLSYLRDFPIDSIKIDRSFIQDVPSNPAACRLVETILLMGRSLEKTVVAEGVETEAQLAFLNARGCDLAQGFLLGKPVPSQEFVVQAPAIEQSWELQSVS